MTEPAQRGYQILEPPASISQHEPLSYPSHAPRPTRSRADAHRLINHSDHVARAIILSAHAGACRRHEDCATRLLL
jgi:hypothetical protein